MASRTGPERLLIAPAKAASARALLALALAALLLSGCGGGSSEEDPAAAAGDSTSAPAAAQAGSAAGSREAGGAAPGAAAPAKGQAGSTPSGSAAGTAQGAAAANGARVAVPRGPREQAPGAKEIEEATVADISLQSPAIVASAGHLGRLDPTYTCDGKDSWPTLRWAGVPAGTAELALFVMNLQPVEEKIFFDWALAGIDPGLSEIQAGALPKGAIVGTNGFGELGYSLCPQGAGETYMFALYALPTALSPHRGFDPLQLRKRVLDVSGNAGLLPAVYERG